MGLKCGIVGLPNIGKSTLFNAITKSEKAEAANYPFCTIEPNNSKVLIEDLRLEALAKIAGSAEIIPNFLEVVDIAGLVKGASKGEGLGNKFLSHIREVDAIIHLVRAFEDGDVTHVENSVDPKRDIEIINTELILADLEAVEKAMKKLKPKDPSAAEALKVLELVNGVLGEGKSARTVAPRLDELGLKVLKSLNLITAKPVIYVANVDEGSAASGNVLSKKVEEIANLEEAKFGVLSVKIESEIAGLPEDERRAYLEMMGVEESGLNKVARMGFEILDLITYFTIGPKEAHAWTIRRGMRAPEAAGVIHTDFEKGFIRAEVISCKDYLELGGENGAKEAGRLRILGKDYVVEDGDIMHFLFNV